ncbi:MAG: hypothetical protein ACODAB_07665, partial [Gemmatimonadota bacterium]
EFRAALDQRYPSRVHQRSAEAAARLAMERRGMGHEDSVPTAADDSVPTAADEDSVPPAELERAVPPGDETDESTTAEDEST